MIDEPNNVHSVMSIVVDRLSKVLQRCSEKFFSWMAKLFYCVRLCVTGGRSNKEALHSLLESGCDTSAKTFGSGATSELRRSTVGKERNYEKAKGKLLCCVS